MGRILKGRGLEGAVSDCLESIKIVTTPNFTKVRVGGVNDGGYIVLEELLHETDYCYSFGIGNDTSFEEDLTTKYKNIKVKAFDPYIEHEDIPDRLKRFQFHKYGLGTGWKPLRDVKPNSMLKMDIEWDEWAALHMFSPEQLQNFKQLVIEFHFVHCVEPDTFSPYFTQMYRDVFEKINQDLFVQYHETFKWLLNYFAPFHIHANNSLPKQEIDGHFVPPLLEISWVRRDLINFNKTLSKDEFPIVGLDAPNKTNRPDILDYYPF